MSVIHTIFGVIEEKTYLCFVFFLCNMRQTEQIYQSILRHLSLLPTDKLSDIDDYPRLLRLKNMTPEEKKANAEATLAFAGMMKNLLLRKSNPVRIASPHTKII
jgi:hypothetical protein